MSSELKKKPVIEVEGLTKRFRMYDRPRHRIQQMCSFGKKKYYREFTALEDVTFSIDRGQAVGIIGRNGSGKSTLLQLICGTLYPTSGNVHVDGRVAALLELGAGFNPDFTGRENVYMNAALLGLSRADVDERFDDILAFADIGAFVDQPVKTYSSGMFVRLAFSVIAHVDADVLVIDEALAVGDAAFGQKCMRFLRRFRETGTILFVSHDTAAVTALCDHAIWLDTGQMRAHDDAKTVCERYFGYLFGQDSLTGSALSLTSTSVEEETGHHRGESIPESSEERSQRVPAEDWVDARHAWLAQSGVRNDIEVFAFDPAGSDFGAGGARIRAVHFSDEHGRPYRWIVGGERVCVRVTVDALVDLERPIIGFYVKDRLGQNLFGDNTFLVTHGGESAPEPVSAKGGDVLVALFCFPMPYLPPGTYTLAVAVADGTQEENVQHQWLHDALTFESHAAHAFGLVGVPMLDIRLDRVTPDPAPVSR